MKRRISFYLLVVVAAFTGINESQAQINNGQYNNRYNPYGRGRSTVPRGPAEPEREPEKLTAEEIVANEMPKITEALELNDFEQAVVSSILSKYMQQRIELQILQLPDEQTLDKHKQIKENQEEELKAGLPEDKYNKMLELREEGYNKLKKKKKKKKKELEKEEKN